MIQKNQFPYIASLQIGWGHFKKHALTLIATVIIIGVISSIMSGIQAEFTRRHMTMVSFLFQLANMLVSIVLGIGFVKMLLAILDGKTPALGMLFAVDNSLVNYVLTAVIVGLIVFGGFLLFIIPGIIWGLKYQYATYLVIDRNMKAMDAIRMSGNMTKGYKGNLFFFILLAVVFNLIGACFFFVGIFITAPVTALAQAYLYRELLATYESAQSSAGTAQAQSGPIQTIA